MASLGFAVVVRTAEAVAAAAARNDKVELLASLLKQTEPAEVAIVVGLLTGEVRQGRIGVGWAGLRDFDVEAASETSLTIAELDRVVDLVASTTGAGSRADRAEQLSDLFSAATASEGDFIKTVLSGGLRQGALDGVMVTAVAKAAGVAVATVRRALMFNADLGKTARIALSDGREGLDAVGLTVGRGIQPMLASTSASVTEALGEIDGQVSVQAKLDGIRLQVHRSGDDVWAYTRNLNDVTDRVPHIAALVREFPVDEVVLDGELIGVFEESPEMFQDTASTFSSGGEGAGVELAVSFFDILHRDGEDLVDLPLSERMVHLDAVAGPTMIDGVVTSDAEAGEAFAADVLARGHEGVMVKGVDSLYVAGRRGKTWRKVKPVYTFDLVVLGAE